MKLHALEIPDDPADLPFWLERRLVGLDLAALVAELEAVHGPTAATDATLEEWLGSRREAVLSDGLTALPSRSLAELLRRPRLLLELQELVLSSGFGHWDRIAEADDDLGERVALGRKRLEFAFERESGNQPSTVPLHRRSWFVGLASAAAALAAVAVRDRFARFPDPVFQPNPVATAAGWGWNGPNAPPGDLPAAAYFNRLADAAEEWFKKRPDDPRALARRIAEFRQGCSTLILADHPSLDQEDRLWLVHKCRFWASKLDEDLKAVEAGKDVSSARDAVDETVRALVRALRQRAKDLA